MGLFSSPAEDARKVNLKALEDARLAFLPQIQNAGTLLMTLTERGSVRAIGFIGGARRTRSSRRNSEAATLTFSFR